MFDFGTFDQTTFDSFVASQVVAGSVGGGFTVPSGGSGRVVNPFGRKRWQALKDAERAAEEAERKAQELKNEGDRIAAVIAAEQARSAIVAERERFVAGLQSALSVNKLRNALDTFNRASGLQDMLNAAHVMERAAGAAMRAAQRRAEQDDEEEAIALLMLH